MLEKMNWIQFLHFFQILRRHKCCTARIDDTAFSSRKKLLLQSFYSACSKWIFKDLQRHWVDSFQKTIKFDLI